jgi:hypothetical protein
VQAWELRIAIGGSRSKLQTEVPITYPLRPGAPSPIGACRFSTASVVVAHHAPLEDLRFTLTSYTARVRPSRLCLVHADDMQERGWRAPDVQPRLT